jgi:DNA-binding NarL/FixJ family response regulator
VERIAAQRLAAAMRAELSPVSLAAAWVAGRVLSLAGAAELGRALLDSISRSAETAGSQTNGPERLTRRETEVAQLIAQGLTNRQIAEELVVALRTVDTHVERILAKLGFTSRAQVAAWVVARQSH